MTITWDRTAAAHLARRAGFGATPAELDALVAMGLDTAVSSFVQYDGIDNGILDAELAALTTPVPPSPAGVYNLTITPGIQKWFLHRMVFTKRPLEEKMTLFWNGVLTSGVAKVEDTILVLNQNKTERALATGKFDDLILAITKDPAMLIWLDNRSNIKGRPNENYARELMELFTLGVDRYTQKDVTEVARALTGWTVTKARDAPISDYVFTFVEANHDAGSKTILGETGNWDAGDAIRIILEHSDGEGTVSGRFLAEKLWSYFAYRDPPAWIVTELAGVYVSSERSIRAMLDHLFRMPEFYEPHARRALVRSPVEYVVASLRQLEAKTDMATPAAFLPPMGHYLFNPVDAKGWEGDLAWMNTGTVFARASFVNAVATNRGAAGSSINPSALVAGHALGTAHDVVDALAGRFGLSDVAPSVLATWEQYVDARSDGSRGYWQNTAAAIDVKVRGLVHLMLTSADFHLC